MAKEGVTHIPRYESTNQNDDDDDDNDNNNDEEEEDSDTFGDSLFNSNHIEQSINNNNNKNHNGMIKVSQSQDSVRNPSTNNIVDDTTNNHNHKRSKFDCIRSNSMEERIQATKQKILNKCESLKKKSSFENSNGTAATIVGKK